MPHRALEVTSASAGAAALTSYAWLPSAEGLLGMMSDPFWENNLPFFGAVWLFIQAAFHLHSKWKESRDPKD